MAEKVYSVIEMFPAPVERRAYERLHETRESHIEDRRRARDYQAQLAQMGGSAHAAFVWGLIAGVAGSAAAVLTAVAVMALS